MRRVLRWLAWIVLLACLPPLLVLGYYALHPEYNLRSALYHLLQPHPPPVQAHPQLPVVRAEVSWQSDLGDWELREASALAASIQHDGVLWSLNDSGSEPRLYAVGLDGNTRGVFDVQTPYHSDWESMDAFESEGVAYLIIGDTGDNLRWRNKNTFVVVAEPPQLGGGVLQPAWHIHFSYADGPRDSEAMAVDGIAQKVLWTSKRRYPAELFELPLRPDDDAIAVKVYEFVDIPRPTLEELEYDPFARYRHMPSGMDIAGSRLLITTYKHAFLYDLQNLAAGPRLVPLPTLGQREALTFAHDSSTTAFVTRERYRSVRGALGIADLFRIQLPGTLPEMPGAAAADAP